MTFGEKILKKISTRNGLTLSTSGVFLYVIWFVITQQPELTENPVVMLLLGQFSTVIGMIYIFYYRKNPSKPNVESLPE